jgi:hypothetical protein
MEQDAAPAVCLASTAPGGAGAPPGDTTIPCEELADGWADKGCPRPGGAVDPKGAA